jgi:hypothetical protein
MRLEAEAAGDLDLAAISVMQGEGEDVSSDEDLNDFNALKFKTENKNAKRANANKTVTDKN